jgi:hypothetical protein
MNFALQPDMLARKWPPNGWKYHQPETGWKAPNPLQDDYRSTVNLIIQHRRANPSYNLPHDTDTVEKDLQSFTAERILSENPKLASEWLIALDEESAQKKTPQPAPVQRSLRQQVGAAVVAAVKRVRHDVTGARLLAEWIGEGSNPVPQPQAAARALVCASCPFNVPGHKFEAAIAETIRRHEGIRSRIQLRTPSDARLDTCDKCGCYLKLKVWMPLDKILRDKPPADLPDYCWIKTEQAAQAAGGLRVAYHGYIFDPTGFGSAARSYLKAFMDAGMRVSISDKHRFSRNGHDPRLGNLPPLDWKSEVHIAHGIPSEFKALAEQPVTLIYMTAWETDRIHPVWVPILNRASEVWVPSEFNRQALVAKLRVPVVTIPHPAEEYDPDPTTLTASELRGIGIRDSDFVFYSIFVWQIRKAPEAMLAAYMRAFPDDGDHVLVLKVDPGAADKGNFAVANARAKTGSHARVSIVAATWSDDRIAALHTRGDCYVSLSRGEGFNLPLFHAVCRAKPVIATAFGGQLDYLEPRVHAMIPYHLVPVRQQYQFYTSDMLWAEPSVGDAAEAMRRVRSGHYPLADAVAKHVRERFSSARIGAFSKARLERL